MEVMEQTRPTFLYSLHNAGFCGVYFYVSRPLPGLFPRLRRVVASQGLPIHQGEPEVPYLKRFDEGVFALFGVQETYDYLARESHRRPGSADRRRDELRRLPEDADLRVYARDRDAVLLRPGIAGPYAGGHLAPRRLAARRLPRRLDLPRHPRVLRDRLARRPARSSLPVGRRLHEEDPKRLAALKREVEAPQYAREATRAEAFDATVCRVFYHMLYLGEVYRLAVARGNEEVSRIVRRRLEEICGQIASQSNLQTLPLQKLVAVQVGAGLHALAAWKEAGAEPSPTGY